MSLDKLIQFIILQSS